MRSISNITRPYSYGETSWEARSSAENSMGKFFDSSLTKNIHNISLLDIFRYYKLNINEYNNIVICPFKSHKNGNEKTASFKYFHNTNSFYCYGCLIGGSGVTFVSKFENITKKNASQKILLLINNKLCDNVIINNYNNAKLFEILIPLSNDIREFRQKNINNYNAQIFIEHICNTFDAAYSKFVLKKDEVIDYNILSSIILSLKEKISLYTI